MGRERKLTSRQIASLTEQDFWQILLVLILVLESALEPDSPRLRGGEGGELKRMGNGGETSLGYGGDTAFQEPRGIHHQFPRAGGVRLRGKTLRYDEAEAT